MNNYCKLLIFSVSLFCVSSCLKDKPSVDFSTVGALVEILPPNGGLENFDGAALGFDAGDIKDSQMIVINIASPSPLTKTLKVTLGVNDTALTGYNNANATTYLPMPDSLFTFPVTSVNIAAGNRLDTLMVYFYPSKIDATKSYMLPVSITDAQGVQISGNFSTVYFHTDAQ